MGLPHPLCVQKLTHRPLFLIAHVSFQFWVERHQVGSLKSAMVGVFTPTNHGFFPPESQ